MKFDNEAVKELIKIIDAKLSEITTETRKLYEQLSIMEITKDEQFRGLSGLINLGFEVKSEFEVNTEIENLKSHADSLIKAKEKLNALL